MGTAGGHRALIVVTSYAGQPSCAELDRQASIGARPRKDYVELAKVLDADVVDDRFLCDRASLVPAIVARRVSRPAGQAIEAFLRGGSYGHICAWSDRIGLPLALFHKMTGRRRDLVLISSWLSAPKPAFLLRDLQVHTHLRAIVSYSSRQNEIASNRLGVPAHKLHQALQPVDERFWQPEPPPSGTTICSVGFSGRDYETLFDAVRGLPVEVRLAVGGGELPANVLEERLRKAGPPPNTTMAHYGPRDLRRLYASARFVVLPLHDVEYDAGVTAITEAMAMGKAVVVTRTRGQIDVIEEGREGVYVPPHDPRALRAAIERLVANPAEPERMGNAGRALVERSHTLTAYVARLAAIIRGEVVTEPERRSAREVEAHGDLAEVATLYQR
jgi:glycosyltransferase involved in cell wall biosynthesis